jgi:hypothetical protein
MAARCIRHRLRATTRSSSGCSRKAPYNLLDASQPPPPNHHDITRVEDLADCLLGIFEISMPLVYGKGSRAFLCLQEEIMKESRDQSLFAWHYLILIKWTV